MTVIVAQLCYFLTITGVFFVAAVDH